MGQAEAVLTGIIGQCHHLWSQNGYGHLLQQQQQQKTASNEQQQAAAAAAARIGKATATTDSDWQRQEEKWRQQFASAGEKAETHGEVRTALATMYRGREVVHDALLESGSSLSL